MNTITTLPATPSYVELSFGWAPQITYTFTAPNGIVIAAPAAVYRTSLTFTATTTVDGQGDDISGPLHIIEYYWDFGDGYIGYGNPVTHSYALANFQTVTKLRVTDSKGRQWWTRAQMYLAGQLPPPGIGNFPSTFNYPATSNLPEA